VEYNLLALKYHEKTKDPEEISAVLNNLGSLYHGLGETEKALDHYERALKIKEKLKDMESYSVIMSNIAGIYEENGDVERAEEMRLKALEMIRHTGDKLAIAKIYNSLGAFYSRKKDFVKQEEYVKKSYSLFLELDDKVNLAKLHSAFAILYHKQGKDDLANKEYLLSVKMYENIKNLQGISSVSCNYAAFLYIIKKYKLAEQYALKAKSIGEQMSSPGLIEKPTTLLRSIYINTYRYKEALEMAELSVKLRDSISSASTKKASMRSQLRSEYEKKAAADSVVFANESAIKSAELSRQSAEIKAKRNQQYALFGGLFLVVLFSIFMYNRFKVTQKQKIVIEHQKDVVEQQKHLVEEKQKEILDSIQYAKRIQLAQIPSEKRVFSILKRLKGEK
jgi:tetratricopeptide (TPR) repeat protein